MRRRMLIVGVVAVAIVGLVLAARWARTGDEAGTPVASSSGIDRLIPARNAEILAQEPIGVDLAVGYDATLALNGQPIPDDQLVRRNGVNEILYRPAADDAAVGFVDGELNCLEAEVWPVEAGPAQSRAVSWCFNVT